MYAFFLGSRGIPGPLRDVPGSCLLCEEKSVVFLHVPLRLLGILGVQILVQVSCAHASDLRGIQVLGCGGHSFPMGCRFQWEGRRFAAPDSQQV